MGMYEAVKIFMGSSRVKDPFLGGVHVDRRCASRVEGFVWFPKREITMCIVSGLLATLKPPRLSQSSKS